MPCLSVACVRDRQDTDFLRNLWKRYSSFHHLCHVIAWLRFSSNSQPNREERLLLPTIQSSEVIRAKQKILFMSQHETFADVFSLIRQVRPLPKGHQLKNYLIQATLTSFLASETSSSTSPGPVLNAKEPTPGHSHTRWDFYLPLGPHPLHHSPLQEWTLPDPLYSAEGTPGNRSL